MLKRIHVILALFLSPIYFFGQSNDCSTATVLSVTANCSSPTNGTTLGATQSFAGCVGTADDDVWYQFTATSANHQITVVPSVGMDPVVQVLSGACASLSSIVCKDNGFAGENEIVNLTGLTIGNVYRIRVYHYAAGSGTSTFSICLTVAAPSPANNDCVNATVLPVNVGCVTTAGTTFGATGTSLPGCAGNADDDVWYRFTATNSSQTITVDPLTVGMDPVFQVYSGSCAGLITEACVDQTFSDQNETYNIVGLTAGQVYYIRVYDYYDASNGNFNICVTGPATAAPTNDEPCNAIALPTVTSNCNYLEFTTVGATATATPGAPSACAGGSGAMIGGYNAGTKDIWFSVVAPSSGTLFITPKPNMPAGRISDGVMVLYSGTCGALTQISCSDDFNFPGSTNDNLPFISATGLTPGQTYYIRFFGFGSSQGTFGLCVTTATNDNCANALYICDINGYSASTSAAYTSDRPSNMRGNAEVAGTYVYTPGTNQGGIFGQAGPWGTGSPAFDVQINNNSWIRFTASATTAVLNVSVIDCWVGSYPSGGIQMQIFSSTGPCTNFTPVSNFQENSTGFTITANGLTVGSDYYLMVDGYAGDICNYTISAQSGVQFPNIPNPAPICAGQSVVLTAPTGGTSYDWAHNGSTSQAVTVSPAITQAYSVDVFGLCGYKQTLTATVTVNPIPAAASVPPTLTVCAGATINLTASTISGATYSWTGPNGFTSSTQNPSITGATAAMAGVYTVTVTVNGCTSSGASTTVTVNPIPSAPIASSNSPVCPGQTINLFASNVPSATYSWTGPSSFTSSLQNPTRGSAVAGFAGTYTVIATVNGCQSAGANTVVVVNPTPSAPTASSNSPICAGSTINLSASTIPSATYSWTGPNSFTSSTQNPSIGSSTTAMSGTYFVTATVNGCSSSAASTAVVVNAIPTTPSPSSNSAICIGSTLNLSIPAVVGATYAWTGPNSFSSSLQNPSIASTTAVNAGTYNLTVTVSGCTSAQGSTVVAINPVATVNAGSNLSSCNGGLVTLNGSFGGAASSVTWSGGTGTYSNINSATSNYTPSAAEILAGTVTLTLTTNDPAGPCGLVQDQMIITISSSPSATFSYPNASYCQSSVDPTPVYPVGSSGGTFTSSGGLSISSATGIVDVSASTPGTYTVFNNIAANGSCPAASASTTISIVATPSTPVASNNGLICENGTINLTTPTISGATYDWTGPNSFTSNSQNPSISNASTATAGTYNLVVTVNGCPSNAGTSLVTITSNPNVVITNGASAAICPSGSIVLTASGASSYVWNTTETTSSISVSPTTTSTFFVTGTQSGCSATDTIIVSILTPPSLNGNPTASPSNCDSPTGSLVGISVNGAPTLSYVWFDSNSNAVGVNTDLTNVSAGNYTVEVTDGNGCPSTFGPFTVVNHPTPATPTVSFVNNQPCVSGTIEGSGNGPIGSTYSWSGPNSFTSSSQNFIIDPINSSYTGNYCLTVFVNGCPSIPACENVTVNDLPVIDISTLNNDTIACINESLVLNAFGGTSYSWTGPNGYTNTGASISIIGTDTTQNGYYVVTGTNGQNCNAVDSINITVLPIPVITITTDAINNNFYCSGSNASLSANGGQIYHWTGPNGFENFNNFVTINPILNANSGMYLLEIIDANGCTNSDSFNLNIGPDDFSSIAGETELCPGQTLNLVASGGISYSWTGPNSYTNSTSTVTITNIQTTNEGVYQVLVTDSIGCTSIDSVNVSIAFSSECLNIPELVTPDADGHNDAWEIEGLEDFPNAEVSIFNRWGNLIYFTKPYTTPWTGEPNEGVTIDGKSGKVPFGTYYYLIKLNDPEGTEYKGYLELQYN